MKNKMEFSKKMLIFHLCISVCLCAVTIIGTIKGFDVTAIGILAGTSFITDGTWGGFYYWKAKNENRAKFAQKFIRALAEKYGIDSAIRVSEVVLKD